MATHPKMLEAVAPGDVLPVSGGTTFSFTVTLYELMGRCYISWSTFYPAYLQQAIALYAGSPPANPQAWIVAQDVSNTNAGSWDTGQPWGSGYSAALLGMTSNGWSYIGVSTPVTKQSSK
jgi:hypothetical protein